MTNDRYKASQLKLNAVIDEIEKVIIGKREVIQLALTALLAGGHVLFEDIPGVGKTMLAKTLGKSLQSHVQRVQFTPDLLPSDILGGAIFNRQTNDFDFRPGPIFTDLLLADEINRTTPRSQAALLEAMSEKQITLDGQTYPLSPIFFVLATQNPFEFEGTYPLLEAQLDRFLFCLNIGYPSFVEELALMSGEQTQTHFDDVRAVLDVADVLALRQLVAEVYVAPALVEYALKLVRLTREHQKIRLGISPRGGLAFIQAAKAFAVTEGRGYCLPDDFKHVLAPVFAHRLILISGSRHDRRAQKAILDELLSLVPVPVRR